MIEEDLPRETVRWFSFGLYLINIKVQVFHLVKYLWHALDFFQH